jgi:hypothetical protein
MDAIQRHPITLLAARAGTATASGPCEAEAMDDFPDAMRMAMPAHVGKPA